MLKEITVICTNLWTINTTITWWPAHTQEIIYHNTVRFSINTHIPSMNTKQKIMYSHGHNPCIETAYNQIPENHWLRCTIAQDKHKIYKPRTKWCNNIKCYRFYTVSLDVRWEHWTTYMYMKMTLATLTLLDSDTIEC